MTKATPSTKDIDAGTVPISVRMAPEMAAVLDDLAQTRRWSRRIVLEEALKVYAAQAREQESSA